MPKSYLNVGAGKPWPRQWRVAAASARNSNIAPLAPLGIFGRTAGYRLYMETRGQGS